MGMDGRRARARAHAPRLRTRAAVWFMGQASGLFFSAPLRAAYARSAQLFLLRNYIKIFIPLADAHKEHHLSSPLNANS